MATQSPFFILEGFVQGLPLSGFSPPGWVVAELQRRLIGLLNHVLMQEPQAANRIARQRGRVIQIRWRNLDLQIVATAAGLVELAEADALPDLSLEIAQESPAELLTSTLRGEKPAVRIQGDVQLAAELNWLVDHVRWDIEEDLARVLGDVPAHALGQAVRLALAGLRHWGGLAQTAGTRA